MVEYLFCECPAYNTTRTPAVEATFRGSKNYGIPKPRGAGHTSRGPAPARHALGRSRQCVEEEEEEETGAAVTDKGASHVFQCP